MSEWLARGPRQAPELRGVSNLGPAKEKARRLRRADPILVAAGERLGRLFLHHGLLVVAFRRLGTTARALGQRAFDLFDRLGLGDALHRRDFAREPVERRLVEVTLR